MTEQRNRSPSMSNRIPTVPLSPKDHDALQQPVGCVERLRAENERLTQERDEALREAKADREALAYSQDAIRAAVDGENEARAELTDAQARVAALEGALQQILDLIADRSRFVLLGPRAFMEIENVARAV